MRNKKETKKYNQIESENQVPHSVLDKAATALMEKKSAEPKNKNRVKRMRLVPIFSAAVCLLIVAIVIPVVLWNTQQANFNNKDYKFDDLIKQTINSIEDFNAENGTEYRYLKAEGSIFAKYNFEDKTVMVSQEKRVGEKQFTLWGADENISVDIFSPFASLSESATIADTMYYYQTDGGETRCKVFYKGYQYNIEFHGYAIEEIQNLIATIL